MYQSLPQIEQDRFWLRNRQLLDKRKKRKLQKTFVDFSEKPGIAGSAGIGADGLDSNTVFSYRRNEVADNMWANDLSSEAKRGAGPTQMALAKTHHGGFGGTRAGSSSSSTNFHGKDKSGNMNLTTSGLNQGAPGLNKTYEGASSYQLVSQRSFWDNVPKMPKTDEGSKSYRKLMINTMMTGSQNVFAQTSPEKFNRSKGHKSGGFNMDPMDTTTQLSLFGEDTKNKIMKNQSLDGPSQKAGNFQLMANVEELIYTNRELPMTSYARVPNNLGNHPLLKRVASEPTYDLYTNSTSTLSFADRKQLQKRFRLVQGKNKLQKRILESRKSLTSVAMLAKDAAHQQKKGKPVFAPWHIPPLPHEEGLGEMLANKSLKHYKIHARQRATDLKTPVRL